MLNEKDLEKFLHDNKVKAEIVRLGKLVMTSKEASQAVKGTIIKTIILMVDGNNIACILKGDDRIDLNKIALLKHAVNVRLAKAKEVLRITGYDIGSVPPFGWSNPLDVILDKSIEELHGTIFAGGGSHYHLIKMEVEDFLNLIKRLNSNLVIADIKQ